jgi:hypothetical protein
MPEMEEMNSAAKSSTEMDAAQKLDIDLQALAKRVYQLMKEEARLQQERQVYRSSTCRKDRNGR